MAGVTTNVCLVLPTISAIKKGYAVQVVMDASGSPFDLSEEMARRRMENAGHSLRRSLAHHEFKFGRSSMDGRGD